MCYHVILWSEWRLQDYFHKCLSKLCICLTLPGMTSYNLTCINICCFVHMQAYYRNMFAPKYVWITPSWYQENWWKTTTSKRCSPEVMKQVLNGSLAIIPRGFFPLDNDSAITTSRMVYKINKTVVYNHVVPDRKQAQSYIYAMFWVITLLRHFLLAGMLSRAFCSR